MGWLRETTQRQFVRARQWAGKALLRESGGALIDWDDPLYSPLVQDGRALNDLIPYQRVKERRIGRTNYFRNAVAGALPDMLVARALGSDVSFKAADADVQEVVDAFVRDPYNAIESELGTVATELLVFGEVVLPIYVTPANADVRLGYLLPDQVEEIVWEPGNAKRAIAIVQKRPDPARDKLVWVIPSPDVRYNNRFAPHPAIDPDVDPAYPTAGSTFVPTSDGGAESAQGGSKSPSNARRGLTPVAPIQTGLDGLPVALPVGRDGQVIEAIAKLVRPGGGAGVAGYAFYHRTNCLMSGRGRSVYERINDWLRAHDDWFFGIVRNAVLQGSFVWDLMIKGGPDDVERRKKRWKEENRGSIPRPGSVFIHNEQETLDARAPSMAPAAAIKEVSTSLLKLIGIAIGLPGSELGAEDNSNRSTAKEAKIIAINRGKRLQRELSAMVLTWIAYQIDQKYHKGMLGDRRSDRSSVEISIDLDVQVVLPELESEQTDVMAGAIGDAAAGLIPAVESGLVLERDASTFLYSIMGLDLPPAEDFAAEKAERAKAAAAAAGGADPTGLTRRPPGKEVPTGLPSGDPASRRGRALGEAAAASEGHWVTLHGEHVFIENGRVTRGPAHLVGKTLDLSRSSRPEPAVKGSPGGTDAGGEGAKVEMTSAAKARAEALFGKDVSEQQLAALTGATEEMHVEVATFGQKGLRLSVRGGAVDDEDGEATWYVKPSGDDGTVLELSWIRLNDDAAPGTGTSMLARSVEAARSLGCKSIELDASRTGGLVGYYVWPRLGFDGPLAPQETDRLPKALKGATRISDLMRTEGGRNWWKKNGQSIDVTFDLAKSSQSSAALRACLKRHAKAA